MIQTKDFSNAKEMDEWVNMMGEQYNTFATQTFRTFNNLGEIITYSATVFWK